MIAVTESGIVTDLKPKQPAKALSPIAIIELDITVFLHPTINLFVVVSMMALQLSLESYILLPSSTAKLVMLGQRVKAPTSISVTEFGIMTDVSSAQLLNADRPIEVTEFGITVLLQPAINLLVPFSIIALHLSRESYVLFLGSTTKFVSFVQPLKAPISIVMTEAGIITDVSSVQSLNAD